MVQKKKGRCWPPAPVPALLQSGGADFLAPWEEKSMSSAWNRGGVRCRAGTEAFSSSSSPMLNSKTLQVPHSCPLLTSLSPGSVGSQPLLCPCGSSGLVFPPQCFPRRTMGFLQQDGWKTSSKHPLPSASTAAFDPKPTGTTQGPAAPSPALLLPLWAALSFPFPGMWVSPQGWECPTARRFPHQDGRGHGDALG